MWHQRFSVQEKQSQIQIGKNEWQDICIYILGGARRKRFLVIMHWLSHKCLQLKQNIFHNFLLVAARRLSLWQKIQYVAETSSAVMRCLYFLSWCGAVTRAGSKVLAWHQIRLQKKELKMFHLLPNVDKYLNMCRHPLE